MADDENLTSSCAASNNNLFLHALIDYSRKTELLEHMAVPAGQITPYHLS